MTGAEYRGGVPAGPEIGLASPDKLAAILPPDGQFNVAWPHQYTNLGGQFDYARTTPNHPLGQHSLATTPETPAVLFDATAAHCSPLLAFSGEGRAIHTHASLLGYGDFTAVDEQYMPTARQRLGAAGRISFVVGGSNLTPGETEEQIAIDREHLDQIVAGIEARARQAFTDVDFYPLISQRHPTDYNHPAISARMHTVRGFIFVPRYIANDGRNHVLVVGDGDHAAEMRTFFGTG